LEHAARREGSAQTRYSNPEIDRTAMAPLAITQLRLVNFRSYDEAVLNVAPGPVVLAGANGSGKTNCLEAVSLLSPGRGLRGAKLNDIQRKAPRETGTGDDPLEGGLWAVAATLMRDGEEFEMGTGLAPSAGPVPRRTLHLNGAPAQTADVADLAPMLWLTPVQDRLFLEGSSERRRFLDRLVFGFDAAHARRSTRYERAMRERLRLLREGYADPVWLDGLEETMAEEGASISAARLDTIALLNAELSERGAAGAFPCAYLALEDEMGEAMTDAQALRARFAAGRLRDGESGRTHAGPHLADLAVRHTAKRADARDCSTGEQKALLLSIVLANAWRQKHRTGRAPFLLLDEVAAHLDAQRRAALFDELTSLAAQAWMTGTDRNLFAPLAGRAAMIAVEKGQFARQD
jgi:DNA replication and repair protein RecF